MTLQTAITEFRTANPTATAYEVLTHLHGISNTKLVKANTPEIKVAIATVDLFNDTLDRLAAYTAPAEFDANQTATAENIARKIFRAMDSLFNEQFYINFNVAEVQAMFDYALILGIISQGEYDGIMAAVTITETPYANTTLNQVKAIMNPATKQLATHYDGSQDWVISTSNRDVFTFVIDAVEPVNTIKLELRWKESSEATQWVTHDIGSIQGGAGVFSRIMQKPQGLSKARLLEWSFTEEYAGQLNSVNVSVG
jgi:hypothetical protein